MRDNLTPELVNAVSAATITTAIAARLEFESETVFAWTGINAIQPTGSGDSLLDGNTFDPLANGVVVDIGENTFSYSGSNELTITLNIPSDPGIAITAAQTHPSEYQGRTAVLWRAMLIRPSDPLAAPVWLFRRIRAGSMDKVEVQADGQTHKFILTIESHQALISNASNQSYLNQRDYDASDASQDYAASIANGDPAPAKAAPNTTTGGGGGVSGGGRSLNQRMPVD